LYRIQRLAGQAGGQRGPSKLPGILALSLGLICFALNMQWARGQQQDAPPPEPAAVVESGLPEEPGVRIDLGGASLIHRDEVEYPEAAIRMGIQGTVVVEATLDAAGAVSDARVLSGPRELRKAALESVMQWHFTHDAAGATRQIGIAFQLPAEGGSTALPTGQRQRKAEAEARARADAKREQDTVEAMLQALARKQLAANLAEKMAEQAYNLQKQAGDAAELHTEAKKLAKQMEIMQAERNLLFAELSQSQRNAQAEVLERQLQELRSQAAALAGNASVLADSRSAQIEAINKRLAEMRAEFGDFHGSAMFAGRRLKTIDIRGLDSAVRDELLAHLPVHVGDTLAEDSMEKVQAAVKQFDEHLGLSMFTTRDGQAEIRIAAQGYGDSFEPHQ
jgi:TonB family protein